MRLLLSKACEYAAQQANGRNTMIGIFENIVVPHLPIDHPPFYLCVQLEFDPNEADQPLDLSVRLIDEDGRTVMDFNANGAIPRDETGGSTRLFIQFFVPSIRFEHAGFYRFDVTANGHAIGEERLPVLIAAPSAP
jgi:hypothetical protein